MSSLKDDSTPAALEHTTRPVSWRKSSPVKTDMSLTDPASHVDPNAADTATPHQPARPTTTEEKRVWRGGQHAMTYNAWLANEKELDDAFRTWRDTDDGKCEVAEVYSRFPGLRLTSMGAEDVSWFVREMSTPGTYLRTRWDAVTSDGYTGLEFTDPQIKLLLLLTSPQRSLSVQSMADKCMELLPLYRKAFGSNSEYIEYIEIMFGGAQDTNGYDCFFPHCGYFEGNVPGWPSRLESAASAGNSLHKDVFTLPPGEESILTTHRYQYDRLYRDTPPYIPRSSIHRGKTAKGIADLPIELLNRIFEHIGLFEGPILLALKTKRVTHPAQRFYCKYMLPSHRGKIGGEVGADWHKDVRPDIGIPNVLSLRKVCRAWGDMIRDVFFQNTFVFRYDDHMLKGSRSQNVWAISTSVREDRYSLVDFKIRCKPILQDGLAQPFGESDEIGVDYEEEVVYLGASHNADRMIFGTDASCDRTFVVKKWINSQLFLDDGGHLAVRAFRLKFDPGTHARELSKQWLSDIFQHLHRRGIGGRGTGSNTLLLDWNARDL